MLPAHYLEACLQEDGGSLSHGSLPSQALQDLKDRRAAKVMGVLLARKGTLALKETKETWASQVRAVLGCWCFLEGLGGWAPALDNYVSSVRTKDRALLCLLASQEHRCGHFLSM